MQQNKILRNTAHSYKVFFIYKRAHQALTGFIVHFEIFYKRVVVYDQSIKLVLYNEETHGDRFNNNALIVHL